MQNITSLMRFSFVSAVTPPTLPKWTEPRLPGKRGAGFRRPGLTFTSGAPENLALCISVEGLSLNPYCWLMKSKLTANSNGAPAWTKPVDTHTLREAQHRRPELRIQQHSALPSLGPFETAEHTTARSDAQQAMERARVDSKGLPLV